MRKAIVVALVLLSLTGVASAHRLDEYLQATLISVQRDHVEISMRLIPGIAVSAAVIASIDRNRDGILSSAEGTAYAQGVVKDLSLSVDGTRLEPVLVSIDLPPIEEMRDGLGEIHIEYRAQVPGGGGVRKLLLENHNHMAKTVYLVNALASSDPTISITAQKRNRVQSVYELDYAQTDGALDGARTGQWDRTLDTIRALGLPSLFQMGVRHIAEGVDHLLFLFVLLLAAPVVAAGSRWAETVNVRNTLLRILKIVTAFTIGHSITLALAAFGAVSLPPRPIEVLIAVSILVSALHALRPIFPGKEAGIAAFFGLIHGLAFASTLNELGLGRWERLAGILAFNLGIEAMQMAVVVMVLPSLILMSRTVAYSRLRVCGALFAVIVSLAWIVERAAGAKSVVDPVMSCVAHYAPWLSLTLFLLSLVHWCLSRNASQHAERGLLSLGERAIPQASPSEGC